MNHGFKSDRGFLEGGGEMGALTRAHDWGMTPLGALDEWPEALRSTLSLCLDSAFPIAIYWGPQLALLYNDAWRPILGDKHPWALGRPAREVWPEIWDAIEPVFAKVIASAKGAFNHDGLLAMNRFGYVEECYFDYTFNPIRSGMEVAGIFNVVIETTYRVVVERRGQAQRDFAAKIGLAKRAEEVVSLAAGALADHAIDVPFALLYRVTGDGRKARLVHTVGLESGSAASPLEIALDVPGVWPFAEALRTGKLQMVQVLGGRLGALCAGPWPESVREAVVLPVATAEEAPKVVLVAGVSPRRALDLEYRSFFESLSSHMAAAMTNAWALETERKRAETLAELDQAKTTFFSNVSHEFRTPLTLMLGPIEDILAKPENGVLPENRALLNVVHRNGQRLLKLVNTLLDFARIEAGRTQAAYEPTDLARLTAELASNFRSACERAGISLRVDCPPLQNPAYVDHEMFEKVVLNLLSNAFKFTLDGEISVELRETAENFELKVADTGSGIPQDSLPRMFERFHRVQGARGRSHEGSGIGLALVQELIKLHGGTITVASALGKGTTFTVRLPQGTAHLPADRIRDSSAHRANTARAGAYVDEALSWLPQAPPATTSAEARSAQRVLLADDNADLREYARRLLAEHYEVEVVTDGEAALAAARARRPDIVVSDVMMPRLDGFGLIQELRADPALRAVPVILLSARAGEEARIEGLGSGADDYLVKPFSSRELLVRVGTLVQSAQAFRRASEALAQFETLLNHAPLGVFLVDDHFRISAVNPVGRPAFGDIPDLIGRDFGEVMGSIWPEAYAKDIVTRFRHTLETGEPHAVPEHIEQRVDRKVTEYYEWEIHRIPVPNNRHGVVCYFRDISRSVLAREALRDTDRRKDEFIATLSHELRNPLAPLRNSLQLLRLSGKGDASIEPIQQIMERQINNLVRLVDDLLEMSRISRGKLELRQERVAIATIVRNAIETSNPLIQASGHQLALSLIEEPLWVDGDSVRLVQILANLLNNAAIYTERGGRIEVRTRRQDGTVLISVQDNGPGIAANDLNRIFEVFSRGERSSTRGQGGLGIGLALARNLAEMHGGSITVESNGARQGSEFTVHLPLATTQAPQPDAAISAPTGLPMKRILVVDDNKDAADSLAMILRHLGADVRLANDGAEALETFKTYGPAVVLLDIGMPGMDGYEVARRIRNGFPDRRTALVALTGWGQEEDRRKAREAGFDHHLVKPVELDELQRILATL